MATLIRQRDGACHPAPQHRQWMERWRTHHPEEELELNGIGDFLRTEDIILDLAVASKRQLFDEIG